MTYRNGTRPKQIAIDNVGNCQLFAGRWRKIKGPKDKLSGPSHTSIKLVTNVQCPLLKYVYQKDNVRILYNNDIMYCYTYVDTWKYKMFFLFIKKFVFL